MTKEELGKLKMNLPRGYRKTLSERMKRSINLVDLVLAGKRENTPMLIIAAEMAELNKQQKEKLTQKIKDL